MSAISADLCYSRPQEDSQKNHMKLPIMTLYWGTENEMDQILPSRTWRTKKLKEPLSTVDGMKCRRT